jgi:hypothetical protein
MSYSEHLKFFNQFLENMNSVKLEYNFYPRNMEELQGTVCDYADHHPPGAGGSIDLSISNGVDILLVTTTSAKVKNCSHQLHLNVSLTIVVEFLAYHQSSLVPEVTNT